MKRDVANLNEMKNSMDARVKAYCGDLFNLIASLDDCAFKYEEALCASENMGKYYPKIESFDFDKNITSAELDSIEGHIEDATGDGIAPMRIYVEEYIDKLISEKVDLKAHLESQLRRVQQNDAVVINFLTKLVKFRPNVQGYLNKWIVFKRKIDGLLK